ncbi:hypothetical protein BC936DRAFT_144596 [Jimgerdemannia flammicorona]|uniref:Uncharacterized protein n=1 Tax=Jimgerdemannia flammicorona TaxID=994334 RepID=A0A433DC76_9FUNG|nr:hypothetical protein BC936DRAFT_144596 [Jimgerdemannia flammicorona]
MNLPIEDILRSIERDNYVQEIFSTYAAAPPEKPARRNDGFTWIDGRGFKERGNPKYLLPSDYDELGRLNHQHYQFRNYQAPITEALKNGIKVIDVGYFHL